MTPESSLYTIYIAQNQNVTSGNIIFLHQNNSQDDKMAKVPTGNIQISIEKRVHTLSPDQLR